MCCFFVALFAFGPRLAILIWWIIQPILVNARLGGNWILAILGWIFLPWTLLMYLIFSPGGLVGFDWIFIGLGVLVDIAAWGGGAARRRDVPGYTGP
ncbi:MAG: hypothetical protein ACK2U3_10465 [Anaerolineales bacterium]|jgi:hypothetical protein